MGEPYLSSSPTKVAPSLQYSDPNVEGIKATYTIPCTMFAFSLSLTVVFIKLLLTSLTVYLLVLYAGPQVGPLIEKTFGDHQPYCVLLYLILSILTCINTMIMVKCWMNKRFTDLSTTLYHYNYTNSFGIISQFMVYYLYMYDLPQNYPARTYGEVMGIVLTLDLTATAVMQYLKWKVDKLAKLASNAEQGTGEPFVILYL